MRPVRRPSTMALVLSSAILFAAAGLALAQNEQPPQARPSVLIFERVELDKILIAPKDQALKRALQMLPMRLMELPGEFPQGEHMPKEALELLTQLASNAVRVGVTYDAQNQKGGFGGAGVVVSVAQMNEAQAKSSLAAITKLLESAPNAPELSASKQMPGMMGAVTPAGVVRVGPRKTAAGNWAFELHLGTVPNPDDNLKELSSVSVAGMTPFLKGRFDPAPLTPLLGILTQLGGGQPQLAEQIKGIMDRNLIGPEAAKWTAALGHTDDATVSTMIMSHVADGQPKDSIGLRPLSEADYNLIPADAYFGNVATLPKGTFDGVKATLESDQNIATALDNIKAETGVDVLGDLIPSIGDTVAAYISDATGGGSLASQVVIVSLADRAKFVNANGKLVTYLNQKLNDPHTARGYISIRAWKDESSGNTDFYSMRFPGVPVPVEPTYAITQNLLVIGLSPQAAVAAVRQATGKSGPGIMSNASIARDVPKGKPITSFAFNDSSKVLRAGYPFVSAFGSMVGNLVRSRDGAAGREPGMIVPVYADLAKDARPQISYAYWEGKNYISEWRGDKSLLVNMGSVVGQYSTYWPIIALGAAAAGVGAAQQQNMMNGFPGMHPMDGMDDDDHMNGDEGDDEGPEALAPATSPAPVRVGS